MDLLAKLTESLGIWFKIHFLLSFLGSRDTILNSLPIEPANKMIVSKSVSQSFY